MGGGAAEIGSSGAAFGAASIPGGGGAMETETAGTAGVTGATTGGAIWPISGTVLGLTGAAGKETGAATVRSSGFFAIISRAAIPICATASKPSTPQAMTEARSRSGDRMVE